MMMDSEEEEEQTALVCDNGECSTVFGDFFDFPNLNFVLTLTFSRFRSCQGWLRR